MIMESALLDVRPGQEDAFLASFAEARPLIAVQPGFRSLELRRCVDEGRESRFLLLVEWERLEDHTEGFRRSAEYERWRALLHPYYDPFPLVEHFGESLV
ncbi:antibiotic biosynthesis monooxygenase family protein [Streptacidiphilus fuscans]|uniref:Antibiotic biosynthesis monooxygenase n=1 Tax=Streptacidiphilus fuscans TaxID=2789292 RepID=A0A931FFX7_9ACTN|nr:antibiotic biosynthesis monooxygenase [Streptacidiphilus fuscans]MBF9070326.1 antibiotic biosynthesis monooxygenase [Streptacidiphilus fuscans]